MATMCNPIEKRFPAIVSVGSYFPPDVLSNHDFEKFLDTSDEWIVQRTGIKERRILTGKPTSYMAEQAAKEALQNSKLSPEDIDVVICATVTGDYRHPATATIIASNLGIKNAFCFDLTSACSSFLYAFITASSYISSGFSNYILVIGADKMSSILNYEDRSTCVLFGDGAGAIILGPSTEYGLVDFVACCDGSYYHHLFQPSGGSFKPLTPKNILFNEHFVYQNGREVFKHAVTKMSESIKIILHRNKLSVEDIKYIIPHQANKRIIDAIISDLKIEPEKVVVNIHKYGNTTSATLPTCLYEIKDTLQEGDNVIMVVFGGGFSWGAALLKWGFKPAF